MIVAGRPPDDLKRIAKRIRKEFENNGLTVPVGTRSIHIDTSNDDLAKLNGLVMQVQAGRVGPEGIPFRGGNESVPGGVNAAELEVLIGAGFRYLQTLYAAHAAAEAAIDEGTVKSDVAIRQIFSDAIASA